MLERLTRNLTTFALWVICLCSSVLMLIEGRLWLAGLFLILFVAYTLSMLFFSPRGANQRMSIGKSPRIEQERIWALPTRSLAVWEEMLRISNPDGHARLHGLSPWSSLLADELKGPPEEVAAALLDLRLAGVIWERESEQPSRHCCYGFYDRKRAQVLLAQELERRHDLLARPQRRDRLSLFAERNI
jgi:predicted membrane metal-binding protein